MRRAEEVRGNRNQGTGARRGGGGGVFKRRIGGVYVPPFLTPPSSLLSSPFPRLHPPNPPYLHHPSIHPSTQSPIHTILHTSIHSRIRRVGTYCTDRCIWKGRSITTSCISRGDSTLCFLKVSPQTGSSYWARCVLLLTSQTEIED